MMVEYFNQASPYDYLKPETSASISSWVISFISIAPISSQHILPSEVILWLTSYSLPLTSFKRFF